MQVCLHAREAFTDYQVGYPTLNNANRADRPGRCLEPCTGYLDVNVGHVKVGRVGCRTLIRSATC